MSIKAIKQTAVAAFAVASISIGASLATTAPAQAAGLMPLAPIAGLQTTGTADVINAGYYKYRKYRKCHYKRVKFWSEYYYRYIWKSVRVCR